MKLLFIMKSEKLLNVQVVLLTYYTKNNKYILKNIIIEKKSRIIHVDARAHKI